MKKLYFILAIVLVMGLLAGCYQGVVTSDMSITSVEGAGTKTIRCYIYKDGVEKPDGSGIVADTFAGDNPYFLKPMEDVVAFLNGKAPAGIVVSMEEKIDRYVLSFTYSFENVAHYNEITKSLIGDTLWAATDMSYAKIEVVEADNGKQVTFTEDIEVLKNSVRWAAEALINDTTGVYNKARAADEGLTADASATSIFIIDKFSISIGGKTETFDSKATEVTVSGFIPEPSRDTDDASKGGNVPEPVENPETGDSVVELVVYAFLLITSTTVIVYKLKRKIIN